MSIMTIDIGIAKNVFAVIGVDESGKPVLAKPKLSRDKLLKLVARLPPCVIRYFHRSPRVGADDPAKWLFVNGP